MFQTVPGGKWEHMPSGKVPQSLIALEKSEKAVLGEKGGADGQVDFSANLASDGGRDQVSVAQLHAPPKPASDAPESPRRLWCVSLAGCSWSCVAGPLTHLTPLTSPTTHQNLLFLRVCLCKATKISTFTQG